MDITFICSYDKKFAESLPKYIHYIPIQMRRGISLGGIVATFKMWRVFVKKKYDLIQYSTPNASLYASIAGFLAGINNRLYCQWGIAYVGFSGIKRKIFKIEERLVCFLSTCIEPDSNSNLEFSLRERLYKQKKGSVIWNGSACGVDLSKFDIKNKVVYHETIRKSLGIDLICFCLWFVGRITKDKGINELYKSFKRFY